MRSVLVTSLLCLFAFFIADRISAQCCIFTYQQQVEPPTSAATFGVALGDFDNDGDQDAVAISAYYGVDVYFNNGSGTFTLSAQYATGSNGDFYGVHVTDVDNDNDPDIIAIPFYTSTPLTILFNNGAGVFYPISISSSIATYNAAVGDIDGDNDIDIFLPNSGGGSGKVFKNNGMGTFTLYQTVTGARGHSAALGDLDNDGDLDAFMVENSTYGYSVFLNDSTGNYTQLGTTMGANGSFVALGDLDQDDDLDAWVGKMNNTSEIWINNGSASFTLHSTITTGSYCKSVNLYDFDNDGLLDIFLGFYSSTPQVWQNLGDLTFTLCYQAPVGSSSHGQAVGFLNNDPYLDIYSGLFSNTDGDYVFLNASPYIEYPSSPYCPYDTTTYNVVMTGTPGGTFASVQPGLDLDSATGDIIPVTSIPGFYTVQYTIPGCSVSTSVTIITMDMGTSVSNTTITANQDSAAYQWVDCNNGFIPLPGDTNQTFTPSQSGNYAVIVTYQGCTDTSACVYISISTDIPGMDDSGIIQIFPNPADEFCIIRAPRNFSGVPFGIYDQTGRKIISGCLSVDLTRVDLAPLHHGFYIFKTEDVKRLTFKLLKL